MTRWAAWRGQRRHHREFRISAPRWPDPVSLTGLVEQLPAPSAKDTPDTRPALDEKDLADAATNLWRAQRRLTRLGEEDSREAKRVGRYLQATRRALDEAGLMIQDHDGTEFYPEQSLEVMALQQDPALRHDTVLETVRPSVYLAGRRIQMGQVIVGRPDSTMEVTGA
ncbi:hypothetical protein SAMN04488074_10422 [Lentzea albidocapillata subsp. violacea]|uniref:GrpE protein n=1 Tax=Lentzea albidocapillata subsp. violacea TaxID=128104 RepID=A0A1G8YEJ8_9PSEU|nr:hypothetical protein [Lentzea albidocapillata]SDK01093.1 hypothetical protein SAMN04488074_10422 [Lentzea albidocapillata subsp. violacea]